MVFLIMMMAFRVVYLIGGGQRVLSRRKDLISNEHPRGRPCAAPAGAIGVSILNKILPYDAERRGIKPDLLVRRIRLWRRRRIEIQKGKGQTNDDITAVIS